MLTLTPEEQRQARLLRLQGISTTDVASYISGQRVGAPSGLSIQRQETEPVQSFERELFGDIVDFGRGVRQTLQQTGQNVRETVARQDISVPERAAAVTLDVPQAALNVVGEAFIGAGKVALPQSAEDAIAGGFQRGVGAAMETDFAKNTVDWFQQQDPQTQFRIQELLLPTAEVGAELGTGGLLSGLFRGSRRQARATVQEQLETAAREAQQGNVSPMNRVVQGTLDETERARAVDGFTRAYQDSMVENRTAINRRLERIAAESSFGDNVVSRDDLIRNLAEEGYMPEVEGRLAKFENTFADIENRQDRVMQALMPVLERSRASITVSDYYDLVRQSMRNDPRVGSDINVALQRIDALEEGARTRYGDTLSAIDINSLKIEGNQKRGDVGRATNDPVVTDVWSNIARTSNEWINNNVPDEAGRRANAEWARLQRIKETAEALNNQQIDVGIFGRALGSYVTTVLGSTAGLSVGGPGGLVVAGLLANIGADTLAGIIRNRIFNPRVAEQVRNVMRQDDELVERLIRTADEQDTEIIRRFLLPAADPNAPRSQIGSGAPVRVGGETPEGRVEPGITERTRENAPMQRSDSQPRVTEAQAAVMRDREALDQAIMEMEVESNALRGENNTATNADGQFYRFKTIPSWVPDDLRDGANLEKAIKNIEQGKTPREGSKVAQLQELVQGHIDKRVAEIKAAGTETTEGVFSNDTAFAIALLAGGSYYLATSDGEAVPILAATALASPQGRRALARQGDRVAKLPDNVAEETLDALRIYDTAPITVTRESRMVTSGQIDEIDLSGVDAEVRLMQLQAKNIDKPLTNAELVEARALLEDRGVLRPYNQVPTRRHLEAG